MSRSIDFAALDATFGAVCSEKKGIVAKEIVGGLQSLKAGITVETGIHDEQEMVLPFSQDVLQPDSGNDWNPVKVVSFQPKKWKIRDAKVDAEILAKELNTKWLGYLYSSSRNPENLPFELLVTDMMRKRAQKNLDTAFWKGVYDPSYVPTPGAANVLKIVDGFLKIRATAIANGDTLPMPIGAITAANAVSQFEKMFDFVEEEFKTNELIEYFVDPILARYYYMNYRDRFNQSPFYRDLAASRRVDAGNHDFIQEIPLEYAGGNTKIIPIRELAGTGAVFIDTNKMMTVGFSDTADTMNMWRKTDKRAVLLGMDMGFGVDVMAWKLGGKNYVLTNA